MTTESVSPDTPSPADCAAAIDAMARAASATLREIEATASLAHDVLIDKDSREPLGSTHFHLTAILSLIRRLAAEGAQTAAGHAARARDPGSEAPR